jgi:glycosyltransferase involved in cell wall biosynthesis
LQGPVAATGLTAPRDTDPERIRQAHGLGRPFVLYLGRVDVAKGCDRLIDDYLALLSHEPDLPDLVLVGGCTMPVPTHPRIHALGFVDDRTRFDALAACEFLINPSAHESLSLVLLEAWQLGKPVLVNADCAVLHGQVLRSGGGFSYSEPAAFAAGFRALADPSTRRRLGAAGQNYVQQHYSWDQVVGAYLELVEALPGRSH